MDIVDINKVLDDLELNEDEHSKVVKTEERMEPPIRNDLYYPYVHGTSTAAPNLPPISHRMNKKNYVNVSNVFNSLNEYVNAEIEAVNITEESPPQFALATPSFETNSSETQSTSSAVQSNDANEFSASNQNDHESVIPAIEGSENVANVTHCEVNGDRFELPATDNDEEHSEVQNDEYIESKSTSSDSEFHEMDDDVKESAQQIITNVTFSPSIEPSAQHELNQSQNMEETTITGEHLKEEATLNTDTKPINDSNSSMVTSANETNTESSIIPPTSLSETPSVSFTLNVDNMESLSGEESNQNGYVQIGVASTEESIPIVVWDDEQEVDEIEDEQNPCENDADKDNHDDNINVAAGSKASDRFIKPIPISFETAATMDDVSDTELESYLQELEDLEEQSNNQREEETKSKSSKKDEIESQVVSVRNEICHSQPEVNEMESDISQVTSKDDRNADSFSQASTVEFGEMNPESDCQTNLTLNNTTDNNDRFPTMNSSETVRNVDVTSDVSISEDSKDTQRLEQNYSDGTRESKNENFQENFGSCSATELPSDFVEEENIAPKRPNTLELPSVIDVAREEVAIAASQVISSTLTSNESNNMLAADSSAQSDDVPQSADADSSGMDDYLPSTPQIPNTIGELASGGSPSETNMPSTSRPLPHNTPNSANISLSNIGKVQPYWIPDNMALFCMQCNQKFSFIKRRHHCRACGLVLCSACCSLKAKLEYLGDVEARICIQCDILLNKNNNLITPTNAGDTATAAGIDVASAIDPNQSYNMDMPSPMAHRSPNPNNPMEYCSVIPPLQQVASSSTTTPISVMVPVPPFVGVLKREGVPPKSQRKEKNVMFSDGIRPGTDLTDLDNSWDTRSSSDGYVETPPVPEQKSTSKQKINNFKLPSIDPKTQSFIPQSSSTNGRTKDNGKLPPICISTRTEFKYVDVTNNKQLIERLQREQLKFMIQRNFYVLVKIVKLTCCINKVVINFTTQGMHLVGQDEIVILLELDASNQLPKDIFVHLNDIYRDADKGQAITELGFSMANSTPFLDSKEHGGFLFIRTTYQCMQNVIIPENPYLIGILIHRWEVPWAKIFPLRLMLRLGALHRYYPSPHVSVRGRNSVYAEIAQTIINFLADFRTYSYTIPTIRGMYIEMTEKKTNVLIPRNRYDQIMKALNNSSDHILALAGNFSKAADGHLVCVQNTESGCAETHAYSTQAINIQGKPKKITGASFLVLNGALKSASGLSGKCSIVEDGLMVQILPKKMVSIQQALKTMKDIDIVCGPVDGNESQTELVCIKWVENDTDFNVGVISPIDRRPMDGVPSIRVHHGLDFANTNHIIRWTEVFILKSDEESAHGKDPIDMSKLSEQIARSASVALLSFLDLLAANGLTKLAIRATLDQDQVCYEAGSNYDKLAPLYMNALDNELIPTLHRHATNLQLDQTICLELIFHILDI